MEKERKQIRNLCLVQNGIISFFYMGLVVLYLLLDAAVKGVFEHVELQHGEIDDMTGWAVIMEGFVEGITGFFGILLMAMLLIIVFAVTIYFVVMWLMFWMANRKTRPLRKRKPWGIADQCCKIVIGCFALQGVFGAVQELFSVSVEGFESVKFIDMGIKLVIALFFLVSGICLCVKIVKSREDSPETVQ